MVEPYARRVEAAAAFLEERRVTRQLREKGAPAEQIVEYRKNAERLQSALDRGAKAMQRKLEEVASRIEVSEARIAKEQYHYQRVKLEVSRTEVGAERDGVMVRRMYRDWRSGGQWVEYKPGVSIYKNDRVGDIVDLGAMQVFLMINEADIHGVRTNMPVLVGLALASRADLHGRGGGARRHRARSFRGGSGRVRGGPLGRDDVQRLGNLGARAPSSAPACPPSSKFSSSRPQPHSSSPRAAIQWEKGKPFVLRRDGNRTVRLPVEGRVFDAQQFRIDRGLDEGATVVVVTEGDAT